MKRIPMLIIIAMFLSIVLAWIAVIHFIWFN